jgi:Death domain
MHQQFQLLLLFCFLLHQTSAGDVKEEQDDTSVTNGNVDENIDNVKEEEVINEENDDPDNEKEEENSGRTPTTTVSDDLLLKIATKLTDSEWKKLASKLNFQDDDIAYFESEHTTCIDQGAKMLTVWKVCAVLYY